MTGGRDWIRIAAVAAVAIVGAVAAFLSFTHIYAVARAHGQPVYAAALLPVPIDGTIAAASLAIADAIRRRADAPVLARVMLAAGIVATLAANIADGLPGGGASAIITALPAGMFIGAAEMLIRMLRGPRPKAAALQALADAGDTGAPGPGFPAAAERWAAELAAGRVPGIRAIKTGMGCGYPVAKDVQRYLKKQLPRSIDQAAA